MDKGIELVKELTNEDLKQIIKEAIEETRVNEEMKLTLTIDEASKLSGIGRDKLMELTHGSNDFPSFKVGVKSLINRQMLIEWLEKIAIEKRVI